MKAAKLSGPASQFRAPNRSFRPQLQRAESGQPTKWIVRFRSGIGAVLERQSDLEGDGKLQPTALEILASRVAHIYVMRNPDKLGHVDGIVH